MCVIMSVACVLTLPVESTMVTFTPIILATTTVPRTTTATTSNQHPLEDAHGVCTKMCTIYG